MRTSEAINEIAGALAKAQGAFENPAKDREVTVRPKDQSKQPYKFKYATFTAVVDAVRKPLSDNGLSFVQITSGDEHGHLITTRLMHSSGQWMEFDTPVFVDQSGAQAFGSGVTYAKRYALSTMLGITADEDDDANTAEGNEVDMRSRGTAARPQGAVQRPPAAAQNGPRAANNGAYDEAAETYTTQAIEAIGKIKYVEALEAWWRDNIKSVGKLEAKHPKLYERLLVAFDQRREQVPHVTAAA